MIIVLIIIMAAGFEGHHHLLVGADQAKEAWDKDVLTVQVIYIYI
jgi:hypothetical protein